METTTISGRDTTGHRVTGTDRVLLCAHKSGIVVQSQPFADYVHAPAPSSVCHGDMSKQVIWYSCGDDTNAFEPIPSLQEKGYYGDREVENRRSVPSSPITCLIPKSSGEKRGLIDFLGKYRSAIEGIASEVARLSETIFCTVELATVNVLSGWPMLGAVHGGKRETRLGELCAFERSWGNYNTNVPNNQSLDIARDFFLPPSLLMLTAFEEVQQEDNSSIAWAQACANAHAPLATLNESGGAAKNQEAESFPVAGFYEPASFAWTPEGYEARAAVKRYSEATNANR